MSAPLASDLCLYNGATIVATLLTNTVLILLNPCFSFISIYIRLFIPVAPPHARIQKILSEGSNFVNVFLVDEERIKDPYNPKSGTSSFR